MEQHTKILQAKTTEYSFGYLSNHQVSKYSNTQHRRIRQSPFHLSHIPVMHSMLVEFQFCWCLLFYLQNSFGKLIQCNR